jgi:outer membrane protein assembly factor BamB
MAGIATGYDTTTGKELWKQRLAASGTASASPVVADGKVYFQFDEGPVVVLDPSKPPKVVATNSLGADNEPFRASPAICHGQIFLRSETTLYCIGTEKK